MSKFNQVIQGKKKAKGDTVEKLARYLKISTAFVRHVLYSDSVPISPRIITLLGERYGIGRKRIESLAKARNRIGLKYYRECRAKQKA